MDAVTALTRLGGVARWRDLRRTVAARRIRAALAAGLVVRTSRGHYALATTDEARASASRVTAVVSHTSAAGHWGWATRATPAEPHLTVRRKRRLTAAQRAGIVAHYRDLLPHEVVDGWVTSRVRTLVDCCLDLPFADALAVCDSACRAGQAVREVEEATVGLDPRRRRRVLAVTSAADRRAANPFESALRAIALSVPGLTVEPQLRIRVPVAAGTFVVRVDLGDERLGIVLEADSFEFHGDRRALDRDCRRYDRLAVDDWLVLRFSWEMVMVEPDLVRRLIVEAVALRRRRPRRPATRTARPAAVRNAPLRAASEGVRPVGVTGTCPPGPARHTDAG